MHRGLDVSFYKKLQQEIQEWLSEGLITPEQTERILERYRHFEEIEKKAGPSKLVTTISIIGSVLIGVGILLFIASNWSEIPRWGKLGIIFVSMIASYGFGYYFRYERQNYPKVGASLILLGSIVFGAGIFLIAQIYNVTVHYPNGPLMWGLGVLPLVYLLRFKSISIIMLLALSLWLGMELKFHITESHIPGLTYTAAIYLMTGITIWWVGLTHKGIMSLRNISAPYLIIGVVMTLTSAFPFTFLGYNTRIGSLELLPFYIGITVLFVVAAASYMIAGEKEAGWQIELIAASAVLAGVFCLSVMNLENKNDSVLSSIRLIFNLIYAAGIIGIICLGYIRRYPPYINIGLLFFVIDVTARYFDFFWKFLPRSLFFIIGGIILLIGGVFLERKRRAVLESFHLKEDVL